MKYYAVKQGKKIGIFRTWSECQKQIKGYSGAQFKSFKTLKEAQDFLGPRKRKREEEEEGLPDKKRIKIYTDGSFMNNRMGIGVVIKISEEVFHKKNSNNISELFAIERAVDLFDECDIYTDSEYCINVLTGVYSTKKNIEIVKRIKGKIEHKNITLKKVKAHANSVENNLADLLAKDCIQ